MASTRSPFVPSGRGKGEAPANAFATGGAETEDRSVDVPLGKNREALIKGENGGLKVPMGQEPLPGVGEKVRSPELQRPLTLNVPDRCPTYGISQG